MVEEVSGGIELVDETITCVDCRTDFTFTVKEILFYASKGLTKTRRCEVCRRKKSAERKEREEREAMSGMLVASVARTPTVSTASGTLAAPKINLPPRERPRTQWVGGGEAEGRPRRKTRRDSY